MHARIETGVFQCPSSTPCDRQSTSERSMPHFLSDRSNRLAACHYWFLFVFGRAIFTWRTNRHHSRMCRIRSRSFKRRRKISKMRRHTTCAWIFRSLGTGLTTIDRGPLISRVMHSSRCMDLDSMTWPRKLSMSPPPLLVAILHECILEATSRVEARVVTIHDSMESRKVDVQFI